MGHVLVGRVIRPARSFARLYDSDGEACVVSITLAGKNPVPIAAIVAYPHVMRRLSLLVVLLSALGCTGARGQDDPAARSASTPASSAPSHATGGGSDPGCAHLFDLPPGAELICDEHVMANVAEIHWRSYGVAEARASVNQRYHGLASSCGVSFTFKPPLFSLSKGERRLETFEVSNRSYPTCANNPTAKHQTVVVVSEKYDR